MGAPWTRDATVRAYVVTMAPEVAGRIVELPVIDNKYVRKGDLLMVIDPTNYRIAVSQAEAAVQQAQASVQNIDAQMTVQQAQISASQAQLDQAQAALVFAQQQAARYQTWRRKAGAPFRMPSSSHRSCISRRRRCRLRRRTSTWRSGRCEALKAQRLSAEASLAQAKAQLHQAQVNLERTRIVSPVDGYVTNLLAQLGDYVNVGVNTISLVDANSFWVDGYFEETNLAPIRVGDPAQIKLMGYSQSRARPRRQHRPRDQRRERAAQQSRGRDRQPDLHLGAPGAAHPGAHPYRRGAARRRPFGRHDGHRRDRPRRAPAGEVKRAWGRPGHCSSFVP